MNHTDDLPNQQRDATSTPVVDPPNPPEVTDIVIVTSPPNDDENIDQSVGLLQFTLQLKDPSTASSYYIEVSHLTPQGDEPQPTKKDATYTVVYTGESTAGGKAIYTDEVSFESNLIVGGQYTLDYKIYMGKVQVSSNDNVPASVTQSIS